MNKFGYLLASTALAGVLAMPGTAWAENLPSSKATFVSKELIALLQSQSGQGSGETAFGTVLQVTIKTANKKDLLIIPSLQCGVVTDGTVKSKGGGSNSTKTRGRIRVQVKVTLSDGSTVLASPANGVDATAVEDGTITGADLIPGITYCDRIQTLEAKFAGLNCSANPSTGAVTCANPEELRLILQTLTANAFVFAVTDVLPGVTTVEVQARALASVALTGADGSLGSSNAFIGAGSVSVEEVRFIRELDITM